MRIIVTGKGGQLASELEEIKSSDKDWNFLSETDLDITNSNAVKSFFSQTPCDFIINCAAYTNVDKAEDEKQLCYAVNEIGIKNLLSACEVSGSKLIHFSTDYVFDGKNQTPYKERDFPNPSGVYGKSKLAGEKLIRISNIKSLIIRTSWVYSNYGHNFVKTMLKLAAQKQEIGVVGDQFGCPTYAKDLAKATVDIIQNRDYKWSAGDLFHYSNEGSCSWHEFADEIFNQTNTNILLNKLDTKDYPTKAVRPKYSILDKSKMKQTFGIFIPTWQTSLERMLQKELKTNQ